MSEELVGFNAGPYPRLYCPACEPLVDAVLEFVSPQTCGDHAVQAEGYVKAGEPDALLGAAIQRLIRGETVALLFAALTLSGCAGLLAPALLLDATAVSVGTWQRWKARQADEAQTEEIRALRLEIQRLRERIR